MMKTNKNGIKALFHINGKNYSVSDGCLDPRLREDDKPMDPECVYYTELRLKVD